MPYVPSQFETLNNFVMEKVPMEPKGGWKVCTNARAQKFHETYIKDWEM